MRARELNCQGCTISTGNLLTKKLSGAKQLREPEGGLDDNIPFGLSKAEVKRIT